MPRGQLVGWTEEYLQLEYVSKARSLSEIAKDKGVSYTSVHQAMVKFNIPRRHKGSAPREKHPSWKGGRVGDSYGYIQIKNREHYRANNQGYVREHLLVWEEYHHKKLPKGWLIHHLNGIKDDNRPQNLVAMKIGGHVHQTEPFKKRIRELEIENCQLRRSLEVNQAIFYINEN